MQKYSKSSLNKLLIRSFILALLIVFVSSAGTLSYGCAKKCVGFASLSPRLILSSPLAHKAFSSVMNGRQTLWERILTYSAERLISMLNAFEKKYLVDKKNKLTFYVDTDRKDIEIALRRWRSLRLAHDFGYWIYNMTYEDIKNDSLLPIMYYYKNGHGNMVAFLLAIGTQQENNILWSLELLQRLPSYKGQALGASLIERFIVDYGQDIFRAQPGYTKGPKHPFFEIWWNYFLEKGFIPGPKNMEYPLYKYPQPIFPPAEMYI